IREPTTERALSAARRAASWSDIVEIRADFIRDLNLPVLLREKPCPVIFTLRPRGEGGEYVGSEFSRIETLVEAASLGADWVDVEYSAFWRGVLGTVERRKVILSHHDFHETPRSLDSLIDEMRETGARIIKIATTARGLADNLVVANALKHAAARGVELCALAMGPRGIPSRILGPSWGSWTTFASLPGGEPTADGQIPADQLVELYRIRRIRPETRLFGVLGKPLAHSLSPHLHNAVFANQERDAVYIPLEAADIEDFVRFSEVVPIEGASVTIPFKEPVHELAASISVEANQTGAVNTLLHRGGAWHGENTDVEGFLRPLRKRTRVGRLRTIVLGAGGAARAVVCGLASRGGAVCVVARDPAKARRLAEKFGVEHAAWSEIRNMSWDLLVNTTPVGMYPNTDESPVPADWLVGRWVYDLVYNPKETKLLKDASRKGCRVVYGTEMFLAQAVKQQQLWFGARPPEGIMQEALEKALEGAGAGRVQQEAVAAGSAGGSQR
ncbi:MAG: shikimate dehydrogenase, partial [Acidobacteria bacterium]|nr:shikimate dehydrogenase [Acidobacteriota bacterium]